MRYCSLLGLALTTAVLAQPDPASRVDSLGLMLIGELDPSPAGMSYGDVWGYAAPDGREYALLNVRYDDGGLSIIDVTADPPIEVAFLPAPSPEADPGDVEAYGRYAYVSNNTDPIQVVDLKDPAQPVVANLLDTQPGQQYGGTHTLTIIGDYLYVQGGMAPGGVRIYSLADPVNPGYVGEYQPHYVHDILVRGDTLYAASMTNGVDIVDLSDRTAPALVSSFNYPGSWAHNVCATGDGSHIFVGDEAGAGQWTRVFDVRDPLNVELVAEIIVNPGGTVHNCHVVGDLLFLAHYEDGVRVWDVSDPTQPFEVAFSLEGVSTDADGVWSFYPHLPSGKLIASDTANGLLVYRLTGGVASEPGTAAPPALALRAMPNPARGRARLTFALPAAAEVRLTVYDALGREVAVLAEGLHGAGAHAAPFDAAGLASGVYLARLEAGGQSTTRTLTLVR